MSLGMRQKCAVEKDEGVPLFHSIHKLEKDWIDANGQYPFYAMAPGKITTEPGENDYAWLMSPPVTLHMEPNVAMLPEKPITRPLSRFSGNSVASKAVRQRSISPNWKTKAPPRYSSPNGRPTVSLAETKHIKHEPAPRQRMDHYSAGLGFENPKKASLTDMPMDDKDGHLGNNMLASNFCKVNGKHSSSVRSTIPPEYPKSTDQTFPSSRTGRSISAPRMRSNTEVPSFNTKQESTNQLSQLPISKGVSRDCIEESSPNVHAICLASFKFSDAELSNLRTGSVSRVQSNHITWFISKREPITRGSQVPSSWGATRDQIQESKRNVPPVTPKSSEFSHQAAKDTGIGRSRVVSGVHSNASIPFTSEPHAIIQNSRIPSSARVTRDCKQENNLNVSIIPSQIHRFSDETPTESRLSRSQSVSRMHSSTRNYSGGNKVDPIIQQTRLLSSSGVTKDQKCENNPNASKILPPKVKTGRSLSVSHVHYSSQTPWSIRKPEPIIQSKQVSSSSGIKEDHKHERLTLARSTQKGNTEHGSRGHVVGSQMVDKFLKARMLSVEEMQVKSKQDTSTNEESDEGSLSTEGTQSETPFKTSIFDSSSCFSRSISKNVKAVGLKIPHRFLKMITRPWKVITCSFGIKF